MNDYDVIVVGAGIAGLTSAAYLSRAGKRVLVCEQSEKTGGLVNSFTQGGFLFDGGMRAIENSGIVLPMLRQLEIPFEYRKSPVCIRIQNEFIQLESAESLNPYGEMLGRLFPENINDIHLIIDEIRKVMGYMDVLYGIDNPYFLDVKKDREYFLHKVIPWLFRFSRNIRKAQKLGEPVQAYLSKFTTNQALIDIIAQHFFRDTPTFFALSYFSLYLDYLYPRGGTGTLTTVLDDYVRAHGGEILTATEITGIDYANRRVETKNGKLFGFQTLVWTGDAKRLYQMVDSKAIPQDKTRIAFLASKDRIEKAHPGDSVQSLFLSLDLPLEVVGKITGAHLFFTPTLLGLSRVSLSDIRSADGRFSDNQATLQKWMISYLENTTYEISVPAMRYKELAPEGQTGLIVSALVDYDFVQHIAAHGWYEDYKRFCENKIIEVLDRTLLPGMKTKVLNVSSATPLSIEKRTGNSGGAITGWSFSDPIRPVLSGMTQIAKAVQTPLSGIFQAGQWSFSPSGMPISILTGKLAANAVLKFLK